MVNEIEIAATTAATTCRSLLASKNVIRKHSEGLSPGRVEMLCDLVDQMFHLGFTNGVEYMGKHILEQIPPNGRDLK